MPSGTMGSMGGGAWLGQWCTLQGPWWRRHSGGGKTAVAATAVTMVAAMVAAAKVARVARARGGDEGGEGGGELGGSGGWRRARRWQQQ